MARRPLGDAKYTWVAEAVGGPCRSRVRVVWDSHSVSPVRGETARTPPPVREKVMPPSGTDVAAPSGPSRTTLISPLPLGVRQSSLPVTAAGGRRPCSRTHAARAFGVLGPVAVTRP
ncbi:hypothetical protein GCM10010228_14470 [Streptomyces massasporeus]|nr:hypothetical protein GCM10010228_14470 [Streptomyces massasporeus]